jgi:hypothetical protein
MIFADTAEISFISAVGSLTGKIKKNYVEGNEIWDLKF